MLLKLSFITALLGLSVISNAQVFSDSYEPKIKKLISGMTVDEKAYQLNSFYYNRSKHSNANMRLGIPNLVAGEALHGVMAEGATVFPQAIAMASTWDIDLIERMGHIVAKEARAFGIHQAYTPMIAVVRDVRWGRIEESFGEDPFLVGSIGTAYIKGLQGMGNRRFDKDHILACAKHYVADGEPMAGANGAAMDVSDYNLHNIHLYPFRMAIHESLVAGIMPAHHLLNGIPCHANTYIMNDILRGEYKWNGLVVSDNQDIPRLVNLFRHASDFTDAAQKSLEAGVHQELDMNVDYTKRVYGKPLMDGIKNGRVSEKILNEAVAANLRAKYELGLFETENPAGKFTDSQSAPPLINFKDQFNENIINDKKHDELALEAAHKSIVLLKNENNLLPLKQNQYKKIAVIGPNADVVRLGGYSPQKPKYFVTILEGIKKLIGSQAEVNFAEGAGIDIEMPAGRNELKDIELTRYAEASLDSNTPESQKIAAAVELAKQSDVVILAIGGSEATCRENEDAEYLGLTGRQLEMVKAVYSINKKCVVVFLGGRPISEPWIAENIPAILQGWYPGQETGTAIADILFGKVNPGGKLPVTIPKNAGQVPLFYNKLEPGRPRKIYRSSSEPLYPFGYGLSYTSFKLDNLKLEKDSIAPDGKTILSVKITNTGALSGDETVQLYIRASQSKRVRPWKELRGFQRIYLNPGQTKTLQFEIGQKQLEYWNNDWVVEPGVFDLFVGTDSTDKNLGLNHIRLAVIKH